MNPNFGWPNNTPNYQQPYNQNYYGYQNQNNQGNSYTVPGWDTNPTNQYQAPQFIQSQLSNTYSQNTSNSWNNSQSGNSKSKSSWKQHSGWGVRTQNPKCEQTYFSSPLPQVVQIQKNQIHNKILQTIHKLDNTKQYTIATALDQNMVVQISQAPGSLNKLVINKKTGKNNQKFKFYMDGDAKIVLYNQKIQNKVNEQVDINNILVLNVQNCSPAIGTPIIASTPSNSSTRSPNQLWLLVRNNEHTGYFIQTFCGKCWDLCEQKTSVGTPIFQYDFNGGKNQLWVLKPV